VTGYWRLLLATLRVVGFPACSSRTVLEAARWLCRPGSYRRHPLPKALWLGECPCLRSVLHTRRGPGFHDTYGARKVCYDDICMGMLLYASKATRTVAGG
jgi:hypothetical protein